MFLTILLQTTVSCHSSHIFQLHWLPYNSNIQLSFYVIITHLLQDSLQLHNTFLFSNRHQHLLERRLVVTGSRLLGGVVSSVLALVSSGTSLGSSASGRRSGLLSGSLLVGLGDNALGQVEVLSQVLNTLVGEGVVVVLPRELGLDEALGGQGLQRLDDKQVLDVNVLVLGLVKVLLGDADTLCS